MQPLKRSSAERGDALQVIDGPPPGSGAQGTVRFRWDVRLWRPAAVIRSTADCGRLVALRRARCARSSSQKAACGTDLFVVSSPRCNGCARACVDARCSVPCTAFGISTGLLASFSGPARRDRLHRTLSLLRLATVTTHMQAECIEMLSRQRCSAASSSARGTTGPAGRASTFRTRPPS